jgi:hypothetical protein
MAILYVCILMNVRNALMYVAALLMLGHSIVPHDHSNFEPPRFILWQLFSVDLGGDHLQHFAPSASEEAPQDAIQDQLLASIDHSFLLPRPFAWDEPVERPHCAQTFGHLSSWSRRPPPSSFA